MDFHPGGYNISAKLRDGISETFQIGETLIPYGPKSLVAIDTHANPDVPKITWDIGHVTASHYFQIKHNGAIIRYKADGGKRSLVPTFGVGVDPTTWWTLHRLEDSSYMIKDVNGALCWQVSHEKVNRECYELEVVEVEQAGSDAARARFTFSGVDF
ncbi:hypothetical protein TWF718_007491 [Orbilia javanica]|uniref:Uncharacterized protein n=1 Tax=Orbilia javanica TaxID=47235 RepID=A0AAN8RIG4_9PEZI